MQVAPSARQATRRPIEETSGMSRRPATAAAVLLLSISELLAHGIPLFGTQVNDFTTGPQALPHVAVDADGSFLVVWDGGADQDGHLSGVFARLINHFGVSIRPEFQVNGYSIGNQYFSGLASTPSGGFIVAWSSTGQDGSLAGVFATRLDGTGASLGSEFQVNTWTTGYQRLPVVVSASTGAFVVVWEDLGGSDGSYSGIRAQRFDSDGTPQGGEIPVNSWTTGDQFAPAAAPDSNDGFIVTWAGTGPGDPSGVFARRFDGSGMPSGSELLVNASTAGTQGWPSVSSDSTGEFVVAWHGYSPGDDNGVVARRFDSSGSPLGGELHVNTYTTGAQVFPAVASGPGGTFVVTWQSEGQDGSGYGVLGQIFHASMLRHGANLQVNAFTTGDQSAPSVAADPNGFVLTWQSDGQDGHDLGVYYRQYLMPAPCTGGDGDGDRVCEDSDNCPGLPNPSQDDANIDAVGDDCDIALISPVAGETLDCTDPKFNRPTFEWDPAGYDRFKVYLSSTDEYEKNNRATSGKWSTFTSWTPNVKKWRKACALASAGNPGSPELHIKVLGKDREAPGKDFRRMTFSPEVEVGILN
jgi:hypothetical protein